MCSSDLFSVNTLTLAFLFLLNNITVQGTHSLSPSHQRPADVFRTQGIAVFTLTIVRTIFPGRSTIQQVRTRTPCFPS